MLYRWLTVSGLAVMWALCSTSAYAFKETPVGTADKASEVTAEAEAPTQAKAKLKSPEDDVVEGDQGLELRIPGVGSLGFLPKLDFGLELLYGANASNIDDDDSQPDDLSITIRGTVKRKF